MLQRVGTVLSETLRRWIPDPFVFAIGLTLITALLALVLTPATPLEVLDGWYRGFWQLLAFGMQMVLILTTGFAIALSPITSRFVDWIAVRVSTPGRVYAVVIVLGGLFSIVSWGWMVLTAVLARELAGRVKGVDYAFLTACVYFSGQPWVGGLSSSIVLVLNTPGNFMIEQGTLADTVPVSLTLGSSLNLLYLAAYFLVFPLLIYSLRPRHPVGMAELATDAATATDPTPADATVTDPRAADLAMANLTVAAKADSAASGDRSPSDRMNQSRILAWLIALGGFSYIVWRFATRGPDIDLNIMIFILIMTGLVVHGTPVRYVIAMKRACSNVSGIIFQYPFYAGIMGIMTFTGLGQVIADAMASGASTTTLPFIAQVSGAVVNFAIPSAGGEWAVIGPTFVEAARGLAVDMSPAEFNDFVARIALAVAYGETSTNLLQPFFLLVVLPVMGAGMRIQARDVMGHLVLPFLAMFVLTAMLVTWA
ncbi:MAG: TIGR00366 family protein [Planctomycetota bacterium]|jgi:short-chain fatty acids transporter